MQIRQADEQQLTKLWNDCQLDRDIAERLGNGYKTKDIANYRRDHNMPSNRGLSERGVMQCQSVTIGKTFASYTQL